MKEIEIWKDVDCYNGDYQVSNLGRVKSYKCGKERILNGALNAAGYLRVLLSKNKKSKWWAVHRLVMLSFVSNPESKLEVNHINGVKADNRLDNLEWCTASENAIHAFNMGLRSAKKGEENHNATLTKEDTYNIKVLLNIGEKQKSIAERYGVMPNCISRINTGVRWSHINLEPSLVEI